MNDQIATKQRSRTTLVLLLLVFITPIVLAYVVYKNRSLIPQESRSHGEIVSPARPLADFQLQSLTGENFTLNDMRGKWSYVYITDQFCDEPCRLNLTKMRNARLAQGGEARRVNYYLVFTEKPDAGVKQDLSQDHPKLHFVTGSQAQLKHFLQAFRAQDTTDGRVAGRVYMIDPLGNYMMFYEDGFDSLGIMEDLKHLLNWSQIG